MVLAMQLKAEFTNDETIAALQSFVLLSKKALLDTPQQKGVQTASHWTTWYSNLVKKINKSGGFNLY